MSINPTGPSEQNPIISSQGIPKPPPQKKSSKAITLLANKLSQTQPSPKPLGDHLKNISVTSQQIQKMASLFKSSTDLTKTSRHNPLTPFNPNGENANDVYMKHFNLDNFDDIIFKPGVSAALRSKICFGLTQIFNEWQNVIVAAKECKATVISREDFQVQRSIVQNLQTGQDYLLTSEDIKKGAENNALLLKHKIEIDEIEDHPGFYVIASTDDSTQSLENHIVLHHQEEVSSQWKRTADGENTYLTLEEDILPIDDENQVTINRNIYEIELTDDGFTLNPVSFSKLSEKELQKLSNQYYLLQNEDGQVLALKSSCMPYSEGDDEVEFQGQKYEVEMSDESDDNSLILKAHKDFYIPVSEENQWFQNDEIYTRNGQNYVQRNQQDYKIINNNGNYEVIGKNVRGMSQLKVDNIFHTPSKSKHSLDLTTASKERQEFYDRIDMPSFINAFLATTLLRPQDGKVVDLRESNVLFQALPNENGSINPTDSSCKLRPVIIDLDETMPAGNAFTQASEFASHEGKNDIHCVRNGLMGFPQARKHLEGNEKAIAEKNLDEIIAKKEEVQTFLKKFVGAASFSQKNIDAYTEVVDKIEQFRKENHNKDWMLQELFFFVFPEYQQQWNELDRTKKSPEEKAMHIGKDSIQQLLSLHKSLGSKKS